MAHFPEKQSISFFGLVAMGIGCMLGTSWLLLTGTWLETAGGPLNLIVAFALCIIIELPFAFAYMEADVYKRQGWHRPAQAVRPHWAR